MRLLSTLALLALTLRADSAQDGADVIRKAAAALRERNAAALWLLFDAKMPGYANFRKDSGSLVREAEIDSTVDFVKNEGDDRARSMELDWLMQITQTERVISTTARHQKVTCKLERKSDGWKIVSFTPADFFAPTHAAQVWDAISNAAIALNSQEDDRSPVNPSLFLAAFDPKMPDYQKLVEGISGLLRRGPIESSMELIRNEGDDHVRTVEVDWSMQVLNSDTSISIIRKDQRVKLQMEWQGKRWRITSLDPLAFFAP